MNQPLLRCWLPWQCPLQQSAQSESGLRRFLQLQQSARGTKCHQQEHTPWRCAVMITLTMRSSNGVWWGHNEGFDAKMIQRSYSLKSWDVGFAATKSRVQSYSPRLVTSETLPDDKEIAFKSSCLWESEKDQNRCHHRMSEGSESEKIHQVLVRGTKHATKSPNCFMLWLNSSKSLALKTAWNLNETPDPAPHRPTTPAYTKKYNTDNNTDRNKATSHDPHTSTHPSTSTYEKA